MSVIENDVMETEVALDIVKTNLDESRLAELDRYMSGEGKSDAVLMYHGQFMLNDLFAIDKLCRKTVESARYGEAAKPHFEKISNAVSRIAYEIISRNDSFGNEGRYQLAR